MSSRNTNRLGLVIRQAPYAQPAPRSQLDMALAAASLEMPLDIFFLGDGVWQLAANRDPAAADLPAGLKGWAAVPDLTDSRFYVHQASHDRFTQLGGKTIVPVTALSGPAIAERWRACSRVMSL